MTGPWIAAFALLWLTVAILVGIFVSMNRHMASVLEHAERWLASPQLTPPGLQPGADIPSFAAMHQNGRPFTEAKLRGQRSIVLFMKAPCLTCQNLSRTLSRHALDQLGLGATTYVVVRDREERDALALDPELEVVFQAEGTVSWAFRSSATPHAFVVDPNGRIAAFGFPNEVLHLRDLVAQAENRVSSLAGAGSDSA